MNRSNSAALIARKILVGSLLVLTVSCSSGGSGEGKPDRILDNPEPDSDSADVEETEPPSSTTSTTTMAPFAAPTSPAEALGVWSFFNGGLATSEISQGTCGTFAVALDPAQPHFLEFSSNQWLERPKEMPVLHNFQPDRVLSLDLNFDGVLEFVIFFNSEERNDQKPFGSVFYEEDCDWKWADIYQEVTGTSNQALNLDYDGSTGELFGYNVEDSAGYFVKHVLRYAPASHEFLYEPIVYEAPPVACVSSFASMYRYDSPDVIQSFNNSSVLRTLQNCREGDWIMEAKKRRSEYETFGDADYYEGNVILLKKENAKDILGTLCNYVNPSGYYIFRKISPVSIACEG